MQIVRISTAGSVDDGKSTLIGRLLYDSNSLPKDIIKGVESISKRKGNKDIDMSLFTDGLLAEREQGITIDVAHLYFRTNNRKYIIADSPGHFEYTRNMVTGASNAAVFVILLDVRNGLQDQTKRHLFIASLMEIKNIVCVINKMDLVDFKESEFEKVKKQIEALKTEFNLLDKNLTFIPTSASLGDNVVAKSDKMKWYEGTSLLEYLENLKIDQGEASFHFSVQHVIDINTTDHPNFVGLAGKVNSGSIKKGDEVTVLGTDQSSKVAAITKFKSSIDQAKIGDAVVIKLADHLQIKRGDILRSSKSPLKGFSSFLGRICWLDENPLNKDKKYILKYGATETSVLIKNIINQLNFDQLTFEENVVNVPMNSITTVEFLAVSLCYLDNFKENRNTGYFVLIDEQSNGTVAVGFKMPSL